jgi:hypothetical protein
MLPDKSHYTYWTVECNTAICERALILLDYIGPRDDFRIPFLIECREFEIVCSGCGETHTYSGREVSYKHTTHDPKGFIPSRTFADATRPETPTVSPSQTSS